MDIKQITMALIRPCSLDHWSMNAAARGLAGGQAYTNRFYNVGEYLSALSANLEHTGLDI